MSEIDPADLHITAWPDDRGKGGQHFGTVSGVKIEHLPTGLVAISNTERSQHRNKNIAMDMLLGGLTSPHCRG